MGTQVYFKMLKSEPLSALLIGSECLVKKQCPPRNKCCNRLKGRFVNVYKKQTGFSTGRSAEQGRQEEMFVIVLVGGIFFLYKEILPAILIGRLIWTNFYFVYFFIS